MWKTFGKTEKAYTLPVMEKLLAGYTTPAFASAFFKRNVYGSAPVNYKELLEPAGLTLKKTFAGKAWIGNMSYTMDTTQLVIAGNTIRNTPLYKAGADVDDILMQVGDKKVTKPGDVDSELASHTPGETIRLVYKHRNEMIEKIVTLEENPMETVVPIENGNPEITGAQKKFRTSWTNSKITSNP
jgi:predicted metalloprotease with PDZ domain